MEPISNSFGRGGLSKIYLAEMITAKIREKIQIKVKVVMANNVVKIVCPNQSVTKIAFIKRSDIEQIVSEVGVKMKVRVSRGLSL